MPGMAAAQERNKEPFQPFSETLRVSPSEGILDGFFNGICAQRPLIIVRQMSAFAIADNRAGTNRQTSF
jgi:hypothetical protein